MLIIEHCWERSREIINYISPDPDSPDAIRYGLYLVGAVVRYVDGSEEAGHQANRNAHLSTRLCEPRQWGAGGVGYQGGPRWRLKRDAHGAKRV
uniref:Uncharacterized protein n=1 Tax=viral metagenome TaxID=1070528 RepID=A0A6M3KHI4_9ZZZZ